VSAEDTEIAPANADARPLDLVCLGEALTEFNQTGTDTYTRGFGGDTSNCAIAAARQGARVGYISAVGEDAFGDALVQLWLDEGINTDAVARDASAATGVYFVSHDASGHRFSYLRRGSAASRMSAQMLDPNTISRARYLHLSAISQAISQSACDTCFTAIDVARANGVVLAYDTNLRTNLWPVRRARAIIKETLKLADIVLPGLDDAQAIFGLTEPDLIVDEILHAGAKVVALTLGADGVLIATATARAKLPAHRVQALDATGAGDTFDGAFLARLAAGDDVWVAGRYANAAAALSTLGYGAVAPIPRYPQVQDLLRA
jgi:2-dehydro-3-deoxygluconokinase